VKVYSIAKDRLAVTSGGKSVDKELLKVRDVAPMLGVTANRVYQLIAAGAIPATRVAGSIRIPRSAWLQWIAERTEEALATRPHREAGQSPMHDQP
jgi:excisionase family DNA binding protein